MRALIVTNMYPTPARPALGRFVADQVDALRRTGVAEVEVFTFPPGGYGRAAVDLLRRGRAPADLLPGRRTPVDLLRRGRAPRFDIVHAHFGLTVWPALAVPARKRVVTLHGTDLAHPRSRPVTLAGLRFNDLVGVVSEPLAASVPRWASGGRVAVLPCGVDLHRFRPITRTAARRALSLPIDDPYLLFAADPTRPEKRFDRARAAAGEVPLLTLGDVEPERVPLYVNAANAVLVPSEREGFGLAVLEALACEVPVLATPVGIAPAALAGIEGAMCAPFDAAAWRAALTPLVGAGDPRLVGGRAVAERYSSDRMAERVLDAWRGLLA